MDDSFSNSAARFKRRLRIRRFGAQPVMALIFRRNCRRLMNIFFDNNEFALKPASLTELEKVVALLRENPSLAISIEGHTDNVGSDADNLKLSLNRAKAVTTYLVNQGIDSKRLTHKGYGSTRPIAPNSTQEGKALNRRTEMQVTSQ